MNGVTPADGCSFTVIGDPVPQGSKRHVGNGVMIESGGAPLKSWRSLLADAAFAARPADPFDGPTEVVLRFRLHRPKTAKKKEYADRRPDIDKLTRAVLDALTVAQVIADDARVVSLSVEKMFETPGYPPGVYVGVWPL
jgi:crossover junction endodeoxyribonuclease RusA